jgi:NAD(P)-dependent dehydrogenase (short-subunit alcohol dehydrogenase family)
MAGMLYQRRTEMAGRLDGKVAIVTGAAHGMGSSHALCLAKEGADVAVVDICRDIPHMRYGMGTDEEMQGVVDKISHLGKRALGIACDVTQREQVDHMVGRVVDEFGKIDILVNNAAVVLLAMPLWEVSEDEWDQLMAVNLKGMFLCCKYVIPHMIAQKYGKIINIGSVWGREGGAGAAAYSASKGGVHNLIHALAKDVAAYNINVNGVAPGIVKTPMQQAAEEITAKSLGLSREEVYKQTSKMLSILNREVLPEDVSNAVVFLASEESRNINGMVIYVDGGHMSA